jgi:hypothetical protein
LGHAEHAAGSQVLNEGNYSPSARSRSRLHGERNVLRESAPKIDRTDLFEQPGDGNMTQKAPSIFAARDVGLRPVLRKRDI